MSKKEKVKEFAKKSKKYIIPIATISAVVGALALAKFGVKRRNADGLALLNQINTFGKDGNGVDLSTNMLKLIARCDCIHPILAVDGTTVSDIAGIIKVMCDDSSVVDSNTNLAGLLVCTNINKT